ncbi:glycosyltransferase family 4 protein [Helicobacter salomonis]|uniref:glycosyltransferase family 4 protein n=1 Tax=Helicobacter salomonis TaxID=56878 RepID=UPI000CF016B4|nr:glycosyltransferase family 4 protein [Helicobacter salomonis]
MAGQTLDYLIITPLPVFYKVNLYNELVKSLKICVVFLAQYTQEVRSKDFNTLEKARFDYSVLFEGSLQQRPVLSNLLKIAQILRQKPHKRLLIGGWDCIEFWAGAFLTPKSCNGVVVESSIIESTTSGLKSWLKRLFLRRVSHALVCSHLHADLLKALHFKGVLKTTHGVGVINSPTSRRDRRPYSQKFICIARLTSVKNLEFLLRVFAQLPHLSLSLVGTGELEEKLKSAASSNVCFLGAVKNTHLNALLCAHDVLILPSLREPWGLVVEEALAVGLPVLVSAACGAQVLVQEGVNGHIFDPKDEMRLKQLLENLNPVSYQTLLEGALNWSLEAKDREQIGAYL